MKKRTYKLAFLLSVVFAVSTEIPSQTKSDTTETASARIDVVNRDFYIAIDKQNVRLLKAVISEYEKLIPLVKERGDRRTEAKILTRAAEAAALTGQMPAALDKLRNALETWESLGEPQEAANILTTIGNVQYVVEDYRAAHDTLERALKLGGRADRIGELDTLIALAGVFKALRDPEKSISTYQDALIISRDGADRYAEGFILERIWIPRKAERLEYLNKAVEAYRAADQEPTSKSSIVNRILTATGNRIDSSTRSEAARFRRFKTEADKQEFLRTSRSAGVVPLDFDVGDRGRGPDLLVTAGSYYLGSGDRKRALDLYLEALNWARQDKYENTEQRILPFLAGYYGGVEKDEEKNTYYFTLLNLHLLYRGARTAFDSNGSPLNARAAIEFGLISIETGQKKLVSNELRTAFAAETQRHYSRFGCGYNCSERSGCYWYSADSRGAD